MVKTYVVNATTKLVDEEYRKSTVASAFDYKQGDSGSPYIITSSMVNEHIPIRVGSVRPTSKGKARA